MKMVKLGYLLLVGMKNKMENPVNELISKLLEEVKQDMNAEYKSTDFLDHTYFYWRGYIDGLNKRKIFTQEEISMLVELNRQLFWKRKDNKK